MDITVRPNLTFKKLQHHQPQRDILLVSTKRKLTCLHKLLRLVKELQIKQLLHLKQGLSSQSVRDVVSLTESIRKRCQKWRLQCCTDWLQIPCDLLISTIDDLISTYHKNATIVRIRTWKHKLRESFDVHKHGAAAFAGLTVRPQAACSRS